MCINSFLFILHNFFFFFCDNFLLTKDFNHCTCFEYSISDYGNIGIDSRASGKSYPPGHCDTSSYHIEVSSIFETRCALYKARDENEGRGIIFLENSKSSGADIRRLFNSYTYAPLMTATELSASAETRGTSYPSKTPNFFVFSLLRRPLFFICSCSFLCCFFVGPSPPLSLF